ncbi:MAG: hypothetical protein Q8N51_01240, partial [Gammaproteobacteria bacterium]|nr:hypothetical protein [Gammaproteobacteria bacterium]
TIDKGVIRLGNAWLERRWSAFLGTTTELLRQPAGEDCLDRKSPEFHLDYGGRPIAAMDLGDLNWSESVDAHGAAITLDLRGPGLAVHLETFLFHSCPGLIRTLTVTNTSGDTVAITRAATEVLPVKPARYTARSVQGEAEFSLMVGSEPIHYVALRGGADALLLGACRKARFALFHPNPAYCAPVWEGSMTLQPGCAWEAPPTSLFWSRDGAAQNLSNELNGFHRLWEARNAADGAFHPSRN